ncbi:MAG: T9SS type A sorting domain-containing protein [Calditrichaeota bacterium]|nr:T9SS type A sorting domain-containing protein [Calditrichota bacterium]
MFQKKQFFVLFSVLFLLYCLLGISSAMDNTEISQIQQAIKAKGASWTAGENWVTRLPREEQIKLLGTIPEHPNPSEAKIIELPTQNDLPAKFDWRNNNGDWLTPVTNQANCGSCWDFSAVAQVETWWKIKNNLPDTTIDLSEQFVLSCSGGTCNGWSISGALDFIKDTGVPPEEYMSYQADDTVPCDSVRDGWESKKITIPGWGYVTQEEVDIQKIKNAVYLHPLSVSYEVFEDFNAYSSGVYEHVYGQSIGWHAVLIVGWEDDLQCWIVKNSWGKNWGEKGYFRIKWNNSNMGSWSPFIWDGLTNNGSLSLEQNEYQYSFTRGDSVVQLVNLKNTGSQPLYYAATDYLTKFFFHTDDFESYDGQSWWCGDPEIGGYQDHWLQWMETPMLDLTTTTNPKLDCLVKWAVEDPAGASDADPNYDGWDGCNVWVSIDGGATYSVLQPTTPAYNCQSMWSFGHPEQGWNYGIGIPGWGGQSYGWKPAEFDLSAFKSDSVIIRFALASDMGYSTPDDPSLKGFFVDEIQVADGSNTIYENHGDDDSTIVRNGKGAEFVTDWFNLENGVGVIQPNGTAELGLIINAKKLDAGSYKGIVYLDYNSNNPEILSFNWQIDVALPQHDLSLTDVTLPGQSIPLFFPISLGAKIRNEGASTETNVDLVITGTQNGSIIYQDTSRITSLASWGETVVQFKPYLFTESGQVDFDISLPNFSGDYNTYNNSFHSASNVSNLVDDFENETGFWNLSGGWGLTKMSAHSGGQSIHVNGGKVPYNNNMDAMMTFTPGFDVTTINAMKMKFWAKYFIEADKDFLYVEASTDGVNWQKLYTMTGNYYAKWQQHVVDLSDLITSGVTKVYVRFHFVSDGQNPSIGALIDDVEIFEGSVSAVETPTTEAMVPDRYELKQNFPNPFNMETSISYNLPEKANVNLTIFNINGEIVRTLESGLRTAGTHRVQWNGRDQSGQIVGTGVYLYQLEVAGKYKNTKKLLLLK